MRVSAVIALGATLVSAPALSKESVQSDLERAVKLFNDFEDPKAALILNEILKRQPSPDQAAKALVYLGLIALNALKTDRARAEFKEALAIDATTELPFDAAPKARLAFDQARRELEREAQQKTFEPPKVAPESQKSSLPSGVVVTQQPSSGSPAPAHQVTVREQVLAPLPQAPPSLAPSIVVASTGAAAVIAGAVFGALANASANQANQAPQAGPSAQFALQAGTDGLVADICFGVGAAAIATGAILFLVELRGRHGMAAVHSDANGVAVSW
jgi:hypothetical protein